MGIPKSAQQIYDLELPVVASAVREALQNDSLYEDWEEVERDSLFICRFKNRGEWASTPQMTARLAWRDPGTLLTVSMSTDPSSPVCSMKHS